MSIFVRGKPVNCPYCHGTFLRKAVLPAEGRWSEPIGTEIREIRCDHDKLSPEQDPDITKPVRKEFPRPWVKL